MHFCGSVSYFYFDKYLRLLRSSLPTWLSRSAVFATRSNLESLGVARKYVRHVTCSVDVGTWNVECRSQSVRAFSHVSTESRTFFVALFYRFGLAPQPQHVETEHPSFKLVSPKASYTPNGAPNTRHPGRKKERKEKAHATARERVTKVQRETQFPWGSYACRILRNTRSNAFCENCGPKNW